MCLQKNSQASERATKAYQRKRYSTQAEPKTRKEIEKVKVSVWYKKASMIKLIGGQKKGGRGGKAVLPLSRCRVWQAPTCRTRRQGTKENKMLSIKE